MRRIMKTKNRLFRLRAIFLTLTIVSSSLFLAACGGSDDAGKTKGAGATPAKQSPKSTSIKKPASLDTSPINIDKVLNGAIEYTKIPECPFLTDKTAMSASTRGGSYGKLLDQKAPIERMRVSNEKCEWSNVSVLLQPAKTAQTLQMRAKKFSYVIKPRKSPTADTVIKYKKVGKKKPVPTTIGFTLGDSYVLVSVDSSYFSTSEKQLQAVADEIAKLLPNAPKIEYKQREPVKPVDFCKVWNTESLKDLYKVMDKGTIGVTGSRSGCNFAIYPGNNDKVSLNIGVYNKGSVEACQKVVAKRGYTQLKGYGDMMVIYKREVAENYLTENYKYCFNQGEVFMTTTIDYDSFPDEEKERMRNQYKTQLKPLFENIIKRITFK